MASLGEHITDDMRKKNSTPQGRLQHLGSVPPKLLLKNTFIHSQSMDAEEDTDCLTRQLSEPARLPSKDRCGDEDVIEDNCFSDDAQDNCFSDDAETEVVFSEGEKTSCESDGPEIWSEPSDGRVLGQTLQLNNIPKHSTHQNLVDFLRDLGYHGSYDFLHVPMNADGSKHCGHAVLNFLDTTSAKTFAKLMDVLKFTSSKISVVQAPLQGYSANYDYYLGHKGFFPTKERSRPPGQWTNRAKTQQMQDEPRQGPWSQLGEYQQRHRQLPPPAPKRFCGWCGQRRNMTRFCGKCGNVKDADDMEGTWIIAQSPAPSMSTPSTMPMGVLSTPFMWYELGMA